VNSRITSWLIGIAAAAAVACIDMSAPNGPASISVLLLPSPGVVLGDVMRDSNGVPAPVGLAAYDATGGILSGLKADFFITDSLRFAHLDPNLILVGDSLGTAHVIGQIGSLQTPVANVPVTLAPAKFTATGTIDTLRAPLSADSATAIGGVPLGALLQSATNTGVAGFVVKYAITYAPATKAGSTGPAVYLAGDDGKIAFRDTTDASGAVTRKLTVNSSFLADADLLAGRKTDSAVVLATTSYKGVPIPNSPLRFVVPIKVTLLP
jgi:hypothetical protein